MKKFFPALGFVALFLLLSLTGCGKESERVASVQNEKKIEAVNLTFFGNKYEASNVEVIESIIKDFMKENPNISVSYESLKGKEYYEALLKRMESGNGDDIFITDHDTLYVLKNKGQIADLSALPVMKEYNNAVMTQIVEKDGKVFMLPTTVSMFGLYCNMDLLRAHGQKVPQTLLELRNVCAYFKAQGITPIIANNDISLKTLATGASFYGSYMNHTEKEIFERLNDGSEKLSDYLRPGYELAESLIADGFIDAALASKTKKTKDDLKQFEEGKNPFMLTGAWAARRVKKAAPDLTFEVHPLPLLEENSLLVVNPDTRLAVNEKGKHKEAALKFVEFFTRSENIRRFADDQCSLSPLKGAEPPSFPAIRPLLPCWDAGRTVVGSDNRLELPIWNYGAKISQMLLSGSSVDEAMQWLDKQKK